MILYLQFYVKVAVEIRNNIDNAWRYCASRCSNVAACGKNFL